MADQPRDPGSPEEVDKALQRGRDLTKAIDRTSVTVKITTEGPRGGSTETLTGFTDDEQSIVDIQTKVIMRLANMIEPDAT